jgi:hypothetical protein
VSVLKSWIESHAYDFIGPNGEPLPVKKELDDFLDGEMAIQMSRAASLMKSNLSRKLQQSNSLTDPGKNRNNHQKKKHEYGL